MDDILRRLEMMAGLMDMVREESEAVAAASNHRQVQANDVTQAIENLVRRGDLDMGNRVHAAAVNAVRNMGLRNGAAGHYSSAAALMRWSSKRRRAPRHSATSFQVGKRMRGLDGRLWRVVVAGKSRRWQRVKRVVPRPRV